MAYLGHSCSEQQCLSATNTLLIFLQEQPEMQQCLAELLYQLDALAAQQGAQRRKQCKQTPMATYSHTVVVCASHFTHSLSRPHSSMKEVHDGSTPHDFNALF